MELVEGKEDTPTQCDPSEFNEKGKTVWFIAVFDKANYVGRLMLLVILDSGFCVFYKGLTHRVVEIWNLCCSRNQKTSVLAKSIILGELSSSNTSKT
jgi:hypothetical protein